MKPDAVRPALRYRNDAVFRSAQRLLASVPAKPARKKLPRWCYFSAGILLGGALALTVPVIWFIFSDRPFTEDLLEALPAATPSASRPVVRRGNPRPAASSTPGPAAPRPVAPDTAADTTTDAPSVKDAPPRSTELRRAPGSIVTFIGSALRSMTPVREVPERVVTGVTRFVAELTLRGEMHEEGKAPIGVEFVLRRLAGGEGNAISGTVRYARPGGRYTAAMPLTGRIDGRKITVREDDSEFIFRPAPFPATRSFVIELLAGGTTEVAGTWTLGTKRGALTLAAVTPEW